MLGNIVYAFNIYNLLRQLDVYTVITGECSGIATLLFFSAQKEKRYALPNTTITFTQPFYNTGRANFLSGEILDDETIEPYINALIDIMKENIDFNSTRLKRIFDKKYINDMNYDEIDHLGRMQIKSKSIEKLKIAKIINSIEELNENPESEVHYDNKAETLSLVVRHTPESNYSFDNRPEKK